MTQPAANHWTPEGNSIASAAAGCSSSARSDREARPGQSRPGPADRVNPLEPLLPALLARLREIRRRQMQEGTARVRTEAGGRGPERGPVCAGRQRE